MANFDNGVIISDGLIISKPNTPTRVGEIIDTISEIKNIPNPVINMKIWVKDEQCEYRVLTLKSKKIGNIEIPDSVVDLYEKVITGSSELNWIDVK